MTKASEFTRSPESVYERAKQKPVVITRNRTNGEVKEAYALVALPLDCDKGDGWVIEWDSKDRCYMARSIDES